ncbi:aminotransferase class I/II-fold pyridoxal phosphate-dependent enzyme [Clostridium botulinum]|uniref:aminotransferase class I/II-fold pyridoxal phosphate-dependent enzyme n=1 Tax=Clostridium botulinum TaxID=1491 RepID=UPI001E58B302|nr:aminotransferase class I/II-fold pyridoxal phosphate-dependent enzyme [Clostridium botulinum]
MVSKKLRELNFNILYSETTIIPIIIGDVEKTIEISKYLLEKCIYIPVICALSVPNGTSRLRISLMATHTKQDLELVLEKLKTIGKLLNII